MAQYKIGSATSSDMTTNVDDYEVDALQTDGATGSDETEYQNTKFSTFLGYYKQIPEVKTAIDMRAIWTLGKGFIADPETTVILDHIKGWGMDTFNSILK